jgi:hypothetical protein
MAHLKQEIKHMDNSGLSAGGGFFLAVAHMVAIIAHTARPKIPASDAQKYRPSGCKGYS